MKKICSFQDGIIQNTQYQTILLMLLSYNNIFDEISVMDCGEEF